MKSFVVVAITAIAIFAFTSCDKRPAAKFRPNDRVRVKLTHEEGTVRLWTRLSGDYVYWLTLPGPERDRLPIRERKERLEERDRLYAQFARDYGSAAATKFVDSWDDPRPYHGEGPFNENELEPAH
jgi:hypothetical protein